MSIWDTDDFAEDDNKISEILTKETFDPVELLQEVDVIQELRSYNKELIAYLTKDDIMIATFKIALTDSDSTVEAVKFRAPCNATEVLCSRVKEIEKALIQNAQKCIPIVLDYIKQETLPDDRLTGYFSKLVGNFVRAIPEEFKSFLKRENYFEYCLKHLYSYEVMDALRIMLDLPYKKGDVDYWWNDSYVTINQLLTALESTPPKDEHVYFVNLREFIRSLLQRGFTQLEDTDIPGSFALASLFCQTESLERLLKIVTNSSNTLTQRATAVFIFYRLLMRSQPEDLIGYGGEEGLYHIPRMTLEERKRQGILPPAMIAQLALFLKINITSFLPLFSIENKELLPLPSLDQWKSPRVNQLLFQLGYLFGNIGILGDVELLNAIISNSLLPPIIKSFFYYSNNSMYQRQLQMFITHGIDTLHEVFVKELITNTIFVEKSIELFDVNKLRVYPTTPEQPKTSFPLLGSIYHIVSAILLDGAMMLQSGELVPVTPTNNTAVLISSDPQWKQMDNIIEEMRLRLYRPLKPSDLKDRASSSLNIPDPLTGGEPNDEEFSFPEAPADEAFGSFDTFGQSADDVGSGEGGFGDFGSFGEDTTTDAPDSFGTFGEDPAFGTFGDATAPDESAPSDDFGAF